MKLRQQKQKEKMQTKVNNQAKLLIGSKEKKREIEMEIQCMLWLNILLPYVPGNCGVNLLAASLLNFDC